MARHFEHVKTRKLIAGWLLWGPCAAAMLGAAALPAPAEAADDRPTQVFKTLDSDGSGKVDRTEQAVNKVSVLDLFDADDDNKISQAEIGLSAEAFAAADRNGDGKISGIEFVDADFAKLETYDADKDGGATFDEFMAMVRKLQP
ncbi:MAG: hypothetical protein ACREE7_12135 [Dongiaceae bacterium]